MATLQKIYSDIDFTFTKKPSVGDIALSYDQQAVIRSVRNLLQTNQYERKFNPSLGSNINALLFELNTPITAAAIKSEIVNTITNYEPRVSLQTVDVVSTRNQLGYNVTVTFFMENSTQATTVTLLLERNR
jgi:phage baseplate assembly protein W